MPSRKRRTNRQARKQTKMPLATQGLPTFASAAEEVAQWLALDPSGEESRQAQGVTELDPLLAKLRREAEKRRAKILTTLRTQPARPSKTDQEYNSIEKTLIDMGHSLAEARAIICVMAGVNLVGGMRKYFRRRDVNESIEKLLNFGEDRAESTSSQREGDPWTKLPAAFNRRGIRGAFNAESINKRITKASLNRKEAADVREKNRIKAINDYINKQLMDGRGLPSKDDIYKKVMQGHDYNKMVFKSNRKSREYSKEKTLRLIGTVLNRWKI